MKYPSALTLITLCLSTNLVAAQCNTAKYCAYTYNNDNCAITTWDCDCPVPIFYECASDDFCTNSPGASCINNLCCHADKLGNGSADCPTTDDLQACGGYVRTVGTGSQTAWVPPHTEIPAELKCGC
ncbi:hypothetical protein GE09DRAFT_1214068 [Coniochaeta sp. 2T2.1]|nr:hypothetical protein GE09DRAFT_1214068 [Coniochaeta sp. 2T2.1]